MVAENETGAIALADLRLLAKAVELRSLSGAARAIGIPKATASRQLQRIERSLGCLLIHRSAHRFALTEEGRAWLPYALRGLVALDEGIETILASGRPLEGTLRIAAPYTYGRTVISPHLPTFMKQHPKLQVSLILGSQHADLLADEADIAIRVGDSGSSTLIRRKLGTETLAICVTPAYLETADAIAHPDDLEGHRIVDVRPTPGPHDLVLRRKMGGRVTNKKLVVHPILRTNEPDVAIAALLQNVGVGIVPRGLVSDRFIRGDLIEVLTDWGLPTWEINALYAPGRGNSPKIRAFLDYFLMMLKLAPAFEPE